MKSKANKIHAVIIVLTTIGLALILGKFIGVYENLSGHPSQPKESRAAVEEVVETTDSLVQKIDNYDSFEVITRTQSEYSDIHIDGGMELKGFYNNGHLEKISESIGLSYGERQREYYLDEEGNLVMYSEIEKYFPYDDETDSFVYEVVELGFQRRYYLSADSVIDVLDFGQKRFAHSNDDTFTYAQIISKFQFLKERLEM